MRVIKRIVFILAIVSMGFVATSCDDLPLPPLPGFYPYDDGGYRGDDRGRDRGYYRGDRGYRRGDRGYRRDRGEGDD